MGFKFFGFDGEWYSVSMDLGMFYDPWMPLTFDSLFLGFEGQPVAKPFGRGRFRDETESYSTSRTKVELLTNKFDSLFLGFDGQPSAKPFDYGRFRDAGEHYRPYRTQLTNINFKYDHLFLGFEGQPTAKPFDVGRFRDYTEIYHMYDTRRDIANAVDDTYGTRRIVLKPEPEPDPYIDHVERMRQHLISEFQWGLLNDEIYDDKPVLRAILTGIGRELDDLDTAIFNVNRSRYLDTAIGAQLDGIGEIVGQNREAKDAFALQFFGFFGQPNVTGFEVARFRDADEIALATYYLSDPEYRLALEQKIFKNISGCTAEETIESLQYIFGTRFVFLNEHGNANISVSIGKVLSPNEILLANALDMVIRAGGVNLKYKGYFNYNHYLGFLGQVNAKGFEVGTFTDIF